MAKTIYTVGHSNHSIERFVSLRRPCPHILRARYYERVADK